MTASSAALGELLSLGAGLGEKSINCDFFFVPELSGDEEVDQGLALLIPYAETPALELGLCRVHVVETLSGAGRDLVRAMRDRGKFEAVFYEGIPAEHHGARRIKCEFVKADPCARDWSLRTTLTRYVVHLAMEVIDTLPGQTRATPA